MHTLDVSSRQIFPRTLQAGTFAHVWSLMVFPCFSYLLGAPATVGKHSGHLTTVLSIEMFSNRQYLG